MWDFSFFRAVALVLRTWPFVLLRVVIYGGIALAFGLGLVGGGLGGYGLGRLFSAFAREDYGPGGGLIGALVGFGAVTLWAYALREWLLYMVKGAHITVLVQLVAGHPLPKGQSQIAYGRAVLAERFMAANALFALDQAIKGVVAALLGLVHLLIGWLPIPGLDSLLRLVRRVASFSLGLLDELILAYAIRRDEPNSWENATRASVLYAQNGPLMLKNAIWLAVLTWIFAGLLFVLLIGPAIAFAALLPGGSSFAGLGLALLTVWSMKAAIIEPIALVCLMQVFFPAIEGQTPDPVWEARLSEASLAFRRMGEKAAEFARSTFRATPGNPQGRTSPTGPAIRPDQGRM